MSKWHFFWNDDRSIKGENQKKKARQELLLPGFGYLPDWLIRGLVEIVLNR